MFPQGSRLTATGTVENYPKGGGAHVCARLGLARGRDGFAPRRGPLGMGMFAPVAQASPGASASVVSWNAGAAAG